MDQADRSDAGLGSAASGADHDAQLARLDAALAEAQAREAGRQAKAVRAEQGAEADYRAGNRVLADLLGGLAGGAFVGWVIDQAVGTRPWGLLVMLFVGMGVAFRNIIRASSRS